MKTAILLAVCLATAGVALGAARPNPTNPPTAADLRLIRYFDAETAQLESRCLTDIRSKADWEARRPELKRQLAEMLGLEPMPARGDLKPVVTGTFEHEGVVVEKLHFQSLPHLYVTANLYRPKQSTAPLPAVLYVCGHGPVITNKISYGNKVSYQHHGLWFARHGYVCLVIDTVQLGEIQGLHHGTYREGMWWWNARGYSPAGVETWNGMRALDYLSTRPEVDAKRFAVTGRSGGGAYSWFIAAMDDRIKTMAPVAGITDLRNHIVDGVVEGHCDCMFFVNTYRWDYPMLAALCAPRPLLLVNTDSDTIFPLDGVVRTHNQVRRLYQYYQQPASLGLVIGPGPHKDTQNLQVPVFRWFNQHLKNDDPLISEAATKPLTPQQLKVFETLPADAINTNIHEHFIARASEPPRPQSAGAWPAMQQRWQEALWSKCFAGWPADPGPLNLAKAYSEKSNGVLYEAYDFQSQPHVALRLYLMQRVGAPRGQSVRLFVRDADFAPEKLADIPTDAVRETLAAFGLTSPPETNAGAPLANETQAAFFPRGLGPDTWSGDARKQVQIRRRFMLLGQTLDGMRVWDIIRATEALTEIRGGRQAPVVSDPSEAKLWQTKARERITPNVIEAQNIMGVNVLYASLFRMHFSTHSFALDLRQLPISHHQGPDYLNVLKYLDIPQAVVMAAGRTSIRLRQKDVAAWEWSQTVLKRLDYPAGNLRIEPLE